jgi:hypothetical protein
MGFANSQVSDIIATTIQARSGDLADNVLNNNPALQRLNRRGNVRPVSGGNVILEEIMYTDPSTQNVNSYSGYEVLNISPNSPISAAQYNFTQYAGAVTISGMDMLQNSGEEQIIDLIDGRMAIAEKQMMNRIALDIFGDGTGNSGKNITGLAAAVPDAPSTGVYGGINRAQFPFWQSHVFSGTADGGGAVSSANIKGYMTKLALRMVRGTDMPDLFLADGNFYEMYSESMQAIQRVTDDGSARGVGAGFASLKFYGGGVAADVVMCSGIGGGIPADHMWMLNTDYLFFRPHRDRNFTNIGGERQAVNQDAIVKLIGWAGNMTSSGPQFSGVLTA